MSITNVARARINNTLATVPTYSVNFGDAIAAINRALDQHGLEIDCPATFNPCLYETTTTFRCEMRCVGSFGEDANDPQADSYVENSVLVLQVYKFETTGRYEITVYAS